MAVDIHLKQRLEELDETFGGDEMYKIFGPTALSWATTDSSRMYMFTSHLKQVLTLLNPDVPRLATGFENSFGKVNHSYKQLEGTWDVVKIIPKFSNLPEDKAAYQIYTIVLYNPKTDTYDMIEKPIAENLTEKFGFLYNTDFMDSLQEGDHLKDPVIFKSTSYDKHMNYRYGKNARVYYSTSTDTIEDAIVIRRGWADNVKSVEVDSILVPVNDNDICLNIYGDDENHKAFPDIGEQVKDSLICATRQINKAHLLYDFQKANMREIMDTDTDYYTSKNSEVYDINVYYNGDEPFPDNKFYSQLKKYYEDGCRYAAAILEQCNAIKKSGSNCTENVKFFRYLYKHYNDPEYKWRNKDKAFSNIIIEFRVHSIISLELGSKITGRFGNKGVISRIADDNYDNLKDAIVDNIATEEMSEDEKRLLRSQISIVDDERMPYYMQDGKKVYTDVMCNSSGAIRRLNPGQLVEVEFNFIAEQIQHKIKVADSWQEKESLVFKFLELASPKQYQFFKGLYDGYSKDVNIKGIDITLDQPLSREAFIRNVEDNGFYIVRPPHKPLLYDDIIRIYEAFPDVTPKDIYVDIFGTTHRKTMRKGIIGYQYMLILKQNSNKNFSARSTFRVNRSNLPAKDTAKKTNRSAYARTPVRLSEIYNILCAIDGTTLAEYNVFMRSSALGRKSLDRILSTDSNPLKVRKLKVQSNFTNANADILAAKLKTMGLRIYYSPIPEGRIEIYQDDEMISMHFGHYTIIDYPKMKPVYADLFDRYNKVAKKFIAVGSYPGEKSDMCWDEVFKDEELLKKYDEVLTEDFIKSLRDLTREREEAISRELALPIRRSKSSYVKTTNPKKRGRKPKNKLIEEDAAMQAAQEEADDQNGQDIDLSDDPENYAGEPEEEETLISSDEE